MYGAALLPAPTMPVYLRPAPPPGVCPHPVFGLQLVAYRLLRLNRTVRRRPGLPLPVRRVRAGAGTGVVAGHRPWPGELAFDATNWATSQTATVAW